MTDTPPSNGPDPLSGGSSSSGGIPSNAPDPLSTDYPRLDARDEYNWNRQVQLLLDNVSSDLLEAPDELTNLLQMGLSDTDLLQTANTVLGGINLTSLKKDLEGSEPTLARARFLNMTEFQQAQLMNAGYVLPEPVTKHGQAVLGDMKIGKSGVKFRGIGFLERLANDIYPKGDLVHDPHDPKLPLPENPFLKPVALGVEGFVSLPSNLIQAGAGTAVNGMLKYGAEGLSAMQHAYRTLDLYGTDHPNWAPLIGVHAVEGSHYHYDALKEAGLGGLGWVDAWKMTADGETFQYPDSYVKAAKALDAHPANAYKAAMDPQSDIWLARQISAGHSLSDMAEEAGFERGTPEWNDFVIEIANRRAAPGMEEAVNILDRGKSSPGRDLFRYLGEHPDSVINRTVKRYEQIITPKWMFTHDMDAFQLYSGVGDAAFDWYLDPLMIAGRASETIRGATKVAMGVDNLEYLRASRIRSMAVRAGETLDPEEANRLLTAVDEAVAKGAKVEKVLDESGNLVDGYIAAGGGAVTGSDKGMLGVRLMGSRHRLPEWIGTVIDRHQFKMINRVDDEIMAALREQEHAVWVEMVSGADSEELLVAQANADRAIAEVAARHPNYKTMIGTMVNDARLRARAIIAYGNKTPTAFDGAIAEATQGAPDFVQNMSNYISSIQDNVVAYLESHPDFVDSAELARPMSTPEGLWDWRMETNARVAIARGDMAGYVAHRPVMPTETILKRYLTGPTKRAAFRFLETSDNRMWFQRLFAGEQLGDPLPGRFLRVVQPLMDEIARRSSGELLIPSTQRELDAIIKELEDAGVIDRVGVQLDELGNLTQPNRYGPIGKFFEEQGFHKMAELMKLLNAPLKIERSMIKSLVTFVPKKTYLEVGENADYREFEKFVENGVLGDMPKSVRKEYLGLLARGTPAQRMSAVTSFLADVMLRAGVMGDQSMMESKVWQKYVLKADQKYGVGKLSEVGVDASGVPSRRGFWTAVMEGGQGASEIAIPNFRELAKATRRMNIARWAGVKITQNMLDTAVTKIWKPFEVAKLGFIFRNGVEEFISTLLRDGLKEAVQSRALLSLSRTRYTREGELIDTLVSPEKLHHATVVRPFSWLSYQIDAIWGSTERLNAERALKIIERDPKFITWNQEELQSHLAAEIAKAESRPFYHPRMVLHGAARSLSWTDEHLGRALHWLWSNEHWNSNGKLTKRWWAEHIAGDEMGLGSIDLDNITPGQLSTLMYTHPFFREAVADDVNAMTWVHYYAPKDGPIDTHMTIRVDSPLRDRPVHVQLRPRLSEMTAYKPEDAFMYLTSWGKHAEEIMSDPIGRELAHVLMHGVSLGEARRLSAVLEDLHIFDYLTPGELSTDRLSMLVQSDFTRRIANLVGSVDGPGANPVDVYRNLVEAIRSWTTKPGLEDLIERIHSGQTIFDGDIPEGLLREFHTVIVPTEGAGLQRLNDYVDMFHPEALTPSERMDVVASFADSESANEEVARTVLTALLSRAEGPEKMDADILTHLFAPYISADLLTFTNTDLEARLEERARTLLQVHASDPAVHSSMGQAPGTSINYAVAGPDPGTTILYTPSLDQGLMRYVMQRLGQGAPTEAFGARGISEAPRDNIIDDLATRITTAVFGERPMTSESGTAGQAPVHAMRFPTIDARGRMDYWDHVRGQLRVGLDNIASAPYFGNGDTAGLNRLEAIGMRGETSAAMVGQAGSPSVDMLEDIGKRVPINILATRDYSVANDVSRALQQWALEDQQIRTAMEADGLDMKVAESVFGEPSIFRHVIPDELAQTSRGSLRAAAAPAADVGETFALPAEARQRLLGEEPLGPESSRSLNREQVRQFESHGTSFTHLPWVYTMHGTEINPKDARELINVTLADGTHMWMTPEDIARNRHVLTHLSPDERETIQNLVNGGFPSGPSDYFPFATSRNTLDRAGVEGKKYPGGGLGIANYPATTTAKDFQKIINKVRKLATAHPREIQPDEVSMLALHLPGLYVDEWMARLREGVPKELWKLLSDNEGAYSLEQLREIPIPDEINVDMKVLTGFKGSGKPGNVSKLVGGGKPKKPKNLAELVTLLEDLHGDVHSEIKSVMDLGSRSIGQLLTRDANSTYLTEVMTMSMEAMMNDKPWYTGPNMARHNIDSFLDMLGENTVQHMVADPVLMNVVLEQHQQPVMAELQKLENLFAKSRTASDRRIVENGRVFLTRAHPLTEGVDAAADDAVQDILNLMTSRMAAVDDSVRGDNYEVLSPLVNAALRGGDSMDAPQIARVGYRDWMPEATNGHVLAVDKHFQFNNIFKALFERAVTPGVASISRTPLFRAKLAHAFEQSKFIFNALQDSELRSALNSALVNNTGGKGKEVKDLLDTTIAMVWESARADDAELVGTMFEDPAMKKLVRVVRDFQNPNLTASEMRRSLERLGFDTSTMSDEQVMNVKRAVVDRAHAFGAQQEAAANRAVELTAPFIDDHRVRSQYQEWMSGIIPFWFAEDQFMRRWARGLYQTPEALRRGQLTMAGFREIGVVRKDGHGNEIFVYPFSGAVTGAMKFGLDAWFGHALGTMSMNPLTGSTQYMMPGFNSSPGQMQVGPVAIISLDLAAVAFPEMEAVRDLTVGGFNANRLDPGSNEFGEVLRELVPASFMGLLVTALGKDNLWDPERLYSAEIETIAYMTANDQVPEPSAGPNEMQTFFQRVHNQAQVLLGMRHISSFTIGSSGTPLNTEDIELSQDMREYLDTGIDIQDAVGLFLKDHPDATAYTIFKSHSVSGAPLPSTEEALQFERNNREWLATYDTAGAWFIPEDPSPGGTYGVLERRAKNYALANGFREEFSNAQAFMREFYFRQTAEPYFTKQRQYFVDRATLQLQKGHVNADQVNAIDAQIHLLDQLWETTAASMKRINPVFAEMLSDTGSKQRRDKLLRQAHLIVADPESIPDSPSKEKVLWMMRLITKFDDQTKYLSGIPGGDAQQALDDLRAWFYSSAKEYVAINEEMSPLFNSVILPLIGEDHLASLDVRGMIDTRLQEVANG